MPSIIIISHNVSAQLINQHFGRAFPSVHPTYGQTCYIPFTSQVYLQTLPPFPCLSYFQGTPPTPPTPLPNFSTEHLDSVNHFHIGFRFFNRVSCQKCTSALTISSATTSHLFVYPTRLKRTPLKIIRNFIQLSLHNEYKSSIFHVYECSEPE